MIMITIAMITLLISPIAEKALTTITSINYLIFVLVAEGK